MSVHENDVIRFVENLRLKDLKHLVAELEERLGVKAEASVAPLPIPPAPTPVATVFDVVLTAVGEARLPVLKWLRASRGMALRDARALVAHLPGVVAAGVHADEAESVAVQLTDLGATVERRAGAP